MNLPLMEDYDAVAPGLAGAGIEWLDKLRSDGLARFGKLGLPGPRDEAWKYTNLTRMGRTRFVTCLAGAEPAVDAVPEGVLDIDAVRLVSVNGRLRPALSNLAPCPPAFPSPPWETRCGPEIKPSHSGSGRFRMAMICPCSR